MIDGLSNAHAHANDKNEIRVHGKSVHNASTLNDIPHSGLLHYVSEWRNFFAPAKKGKKINSHTNEGEPSKNIYSIASLGYYLTLENIALSIYHIRA